MSSRVAQLIITLGIVACAPLAWVVVSAGDERRPDADQVWEPPDVSAVERWVIAAVSSVLVLTALVAVQLGLRRRRFTASIWEVVGSLAALSAYVGCFYAVATAPVVGANIGAGLMYMGLFVAVPLAIGFACRAWLRRRRSPHATAQ